MGYVREQIKANAERRAVDQPRWAAITAEAREAGLAAGNAHTPTPMLVYEADLLSGKAMPDGKAWHVPEGVCGFASVVLSAAAGSEGARFINYLTVDRDRDYVTGATAEKPRVRILLGCEPAITGSRGYQGRFTIHISDHNQSYERKRAHTAALLSVLLAGVPGLRGYVDARLD